MTKYSVSTSIDIPLNIKHKIYNISNRKDTISIARLSEEIDTDVVIIQEAINEMNMNKIDKGVYDTDCDYMYSDTKYIITELKPTRSHREKWIGKTITDKEVYLTINNDIDSDKYNKEIFLRIGDEERYYNATTTDNPSLREVYYNLPEDIVIDDLKRISDERMEYILNPEMPSEDEIREAIKMDKYPTYNDFKSFKYPKDDNTFHPAFIHWIARRNVGNNKDSNYDEKILSFYNNDNMTADQLYNELTNLTNERENSYLVDKIK